MRIVAGSRKGHRIAAPKGVVTRPTSDRVREALFSIVGHVEGAAALDLFAGSGALGLEALSRGAASCLFAEQDPAAIRALRSNIANLRAQQRCDVRAGSVLQLGPAKAPCDLVLLDPPYHSGAGAVALDRLARLGWIGEATWVALETAYDEVVHVKSLSVESERKVGRAKLTLLRLSDDRR